MKRIIKNLSKMLPAVHLCREDLDEIINVLRSCNQKVIIETLDYEFESIDELEKQFGDKINQLTLACHNPHVSLSFNREIPGIHLYSSFESEKAKTAFYEIKDLLEKRKAVLNYVFSPILGCISFLIMLLYISLSDTEWIDRFVPNQFERFSVFLFLICIGIAAVLYKSGILYSITLKKRHENKSFFVRRKDQIILVILGALIGAIATWLLNMYFT